MASIGETPQAKRSHRKSRRGCFTCKQRKVKCDEERPVCRHCARRFEGIQSCDYESPGLYTFDKAIGGGKLQAIRRPRPTNPSITSISVQPASLNTSNPKARSLELRLFYHFVRVTANDMPLSIIPALRTIWDFETPQLSFDHEALFYSMIGTAALHLHRSDETGSTEMLRTSQGCFLRSLELHKNDVMNINRSNAKASVLTATLLATLIQLVFRSLEPNTPYTFGIERFEFIRGIAAMLPTAMPYIIDTPVAEILFAWPPDNNSDCLSQPLEVRDGILSSYVSSVYNGTDENISGFISPPLTPAMLEMSFANINDPNIAAILSPLNSTPSEDPNASVYGSISTQLLAIYRAILVDEEGYWIYRRMEGVPSILPAEAMTLMRDHDPRILTLLARYYALMSTLRGFWWVKGVGAYEVHGIADMMKGTPLEKEMEWPLRVVNEGLWKTLSADENPIEPPTIIEERVQPVLDDEQPSLALSGDS